MSTPIKPETEARILLEAFVDRIRSNLKAEVQKAIQPSIDYAVERAVAELNVTIQREFNLREQQMVCHLIVNRPEVK